MSKNNALDSEQLTDSMYYILLALLQVRHGYAIMKFVEEITQKEMVIGPGTLYTLLKKLSKANWIQQLDNQDDRQKCYVITPEGTHILIQEYHRRERMIKVGKEVLKEAGYEK